MFEADAQNSGSGALSRVYRSYAERREKLETAVDAIRRRHGENAIIRGNTGNPEIGLEGAWKRKEKARKEEKRRDRRQRGSSLRRSNWSQRYRAAVQKTAKKEKHEQNQSVFQGQLPPLQKVVRLHEA